MRGIHPYQHTIRDQPAECLFFRMNDGYFTNDQALAYAYQATDPWRRAQSLIKLSGHLPDNKRKDVFRGVLAAAWELRHQGHSSKDEDDPYSRDSWAENAACLLEELAPVLPEDLFEEALHAARQAEDGLAWSMAMAGLLPRFSAAAAERELEFLNRFSPDDQARFIGELVLGLPQSFLVRALHIVEQADNEEALTIGLASSTSTLPESQLQEVLDSTKRLRYSVDKSRVLAKFARPLPLEILKEVFDSAQTMSAQTFMDESYRSSLLNVLVPFLPDDWLGQARAAIFDLRYIYCRLQYLKVLGPRLASELD